jgi:hypothetical protein
VGNVGDTPKKAQEYKKFKDTGSLKISGKVLVSRDFYLIFYSLRSIKSQ